ncbi:glycosyltransferase [Nocardia sp. SYP-A9097]|uniref:glycosyltransferase family 2 protein n=1 Tax=Nocardia sp. SYP-A9097 TaxID=2663237 RepID=UPI00129A7088|nr:glycosyltransferase family A protein [Nocardia sp. SYP-A9097]MRH89792.1 glycosyltransferase [Nocardia sp. SYP-A9097]
MSQPVFSILSAAHLAEPYLAEMIDSVVAQTMTEWELIVVDNGMSEEVVRIVGRYADDPRIRLSRREFDGLGGGVDAAAGLARGRYFAVVHGDDVLLPDFCARTAELLDANPGVDVVGVEAFGFTDDHVTAPIGYRALAGVTVERGFDHRVTLEEVADGQVLYYTAAIRAQAWKIGVGYTCDTPQVEDLAMFIRMLAAGCDIRVLPEHLAGYRLHDQGPAPADREVYEDSVERVYELAGTLSDAANVQAAVDRTLRKVKFEHAVRRARESLLRSDTTTARDNARLALRQRRALRPMVIYAGLTVAPGILRRIHPMKQRISALVGRVRH